MPIDAVFLESLCEELQEKLLACRVDKVQQPERDTILLSMRGASGGGKLLLTASPNHPRIQLTSLSFENPAQPPMFCMLLRKHLTGGRLVSITQPPMERLAELTFDCIDEMGTPCQKKLILELMGRNSNLILTGADGRILDCLRRVDFEMSEQRQVLPGLYYHLPPRRESAIRGKHPRTICARCSVPRRHRKRRTRSYWRASEDSRRFFVGSLPSACSVRSILIWPPCRTRKNSRLPSGFLRSCKRCTPAKKCRRFCCETADHGTLPVCRFANMKVLSRRKLHRRFPRCSTAFMPSATFSKAHARRRRRFAKRLRISTAARQESSRIRKKSLKRPLTVSTSGGSAIS